MSQLLKVAPSPHVHHPENTSRIMWTVVLALLPALAWSIWVFGWQALRVSLEGVLFCALVEWAIQKFMFRKPATLQDGSAVLTGLLLAFNVPSGLPGWQLMAGAAVAIGVGKMAFGGLGRNPFNPALVGRAFMLASFPVSMTTWPIPFSNAWSLVDAKTAATPLGLLKEGLKKGEAMDAIQKTLPSHMDLFLGQVGGCIGEISVVALLLGGLWLLWKGIITWRIPVFYLLGLVLFTGPFWLSDSQHFADPLFHLLSGGVMLGAWFMATDMVTSPMSNRGQIIFALAGGVICGAIRLFGAYTEGCSYSILIMNAFVPLLDRAFKPRSFAPRQVTHEQ